MSEKREPTRADELIVRVLQGKASPRERSVLDEWRKAEPENERRFAAVTRIWAGTHGLDPSLETAPIPRPAVEELSGSGGAGSGQDAETVSTGAWQGEREPTRDPGNSARAPLPSRSQEPRSTWARALAKVAAILALVGSGYFAAGVVQPDGTPVQDITATELRTGPDEMTTARLNDGTVVRLAPDTRLRFMGRNGVREVWLEGQAYFAVDPLSEGRFSVRTPSGEAEVLGTRFDVEARERSLQVVVVEGRVSLSDGVEQVEVAASQMTRFEEGRRAEVVDLENVYDVISWMDRPLAFQATPLSEVARELEARCDVEVRLEDQALAQRTVTAWFANQECEDVLSVICRAVDAHCSTDGQATSITTAGPHP